MSRKNGGIIGPANTPVGGLFKGVAGGVWRMNDVLNFVSNSQWPSTPKSIDNSLRFNDGSSDYLSFTPSSAPTSSRIATISFWFKLSAIKTNFNFFSANQSGLSNPASFKILLRDSNGRLELQQDDGSAGNDFSLRTSQYLKDPSSWYHLVAAYDTTQGTASDRIKLYINGSQVTSFSQENYPTQNLDLWLGDTDAHNVGRDVAYSASYYDGYMAEFVYIDGQQLTPSSFGETDSTTGIWKPKKIGSFSSAGTNSFYLDFKDSSNVGKDASGLSNNFTVNNLTSIDQSTDTCVENFATMNPLNDLLSTSVAFSEGNLQVATTDSAVFGSSSTIGASSGKWYMEVKPTQIQNKMAIGVTASAPEDARNNHRPGDGAYSAGIRSSGDAKLNGSSESGSWDSFTTSDIVGVALDLDNNKLYFSKNGTFMNSGDPTSGSTGTGAISLTDPASTTDGFYFFAFGDPGAGSGTANIAQFNFGSPPYSISSGNSDANGFGNFEYSVPSGYYALNTSNLNTYG